MVMIFALALAAAAPPWTEVSRTDELVVHARHRDESDVNVMRATGVVAGPAR